MVEHIPTMITITVHPNGSRTSYRFNQEQIVIGDGLPGAVDICFPSEGLHQNHVRILLKEGSYQIVNQANDPFVTLNGQPFGKKQLAAGDLLQIRNHILRVDEISFSDQVEKSLPPLQTAAPSFPDIEALYHEDDPEIWLPGDFPLEEPPKIKTVAPPVPIDPRVEEAYQLHEEPVLKKREQAPPAPPKHKRWKMRLLKFTALGILVAVSATALMLAELYLRASNLSETEEMAAAESLADYAMALTFARIYQTSIQKQNWVDPQFIRNNLIDLLSSTSIPCGDIDAQGAFCNSPYFLRFYTNRDATRFLLIAQPNANLSQWLFPKRSILVDSTQMTLHTAEDLRQINRLLSTSGALEGEEGEELNKTLQQLPTLKLTDLASATGKKEFAPPSALKYISPGAENLIYNAPRYHHLSGTFLKKAQTIISQPYGQHVAALLQNDLDALAKLHHLVFYLDTSMQEAVKTRMVLRKLSVQPPFFTAYLIHDDQKAIINSRLVFDSSHETSHDERELAEQPFFKPKTYKKPLIEGDQTARAIRETAEAAHKTIVPILQSLHTLLSDAAERDSLYLSPLFYSLMEQYEEQKQKIAKMLLGKVPDDSHGEKLLRETGLWDLYQSYNKPSETAENLPPHERWNAMEEVRKMTLKKMTPSK